MRIDSAAAKTALPLFEAQKNDAALRKACREFESLLTAQMLQKMRDSVHKSDLFGSREKEEIFQSMLDEEMAKHIAHTGALGLGDTIYAQLKARNIAKVPENSVDR